MAKRKPILSTDNLTFIEEVPRKKYSRMAKYRCKCGNIFVASVNSVRCNDTKSCGCIIKSGSHHRTHNKSKSKLYAIWANMKSRCYNINDEYYSEYGKRGIKVFPIWQVDFIAFEDYVSALPNFGVKGYSIDRINNNGNYEPGNLRWATPHIQSTNSRRQKNNTSGYSGVYFNNGKWSAYIKIMGKLKFIGRFINIEDAVIARNNYIMENKLFEYRIQTIKF